jgi:hypothetical protein
VNIFDDFNTNAIVTRVVYDIKRLYHQTVVSPWYETSRFGGAPKLSPEERLDRARRGLPEPKDEASVILRTVVLENEHTAAKHIVTEIVYGERKEVKDVDVKVPYQHDFTAHNPWTFVYERYEPRTGWDAFKKWVLDACPDWLFLCLLGFLPEMVWTESTFQGIATRDYSLIGQTPYTYVHTTQYLRDPFLEERYGKLDRDRAYLEIVRPGGAG